MSLMASKGLDEFNGFPSHPVVLQTVKAPAAIDSETGMMPLLAGRAVSGPGRPRSVSFSAAECASH